MTTSWSFGPAHPCRGHPAHFAYRIIWSAHPRCRSPGENRASRSGAVRREAARVSVGLRGAGEKVDGLRLDLNAPPQISNATLISNSALHGLRASFEIDPPMQI